MSVGALDTAGTRHRPKYVAVFPVRALVEFTSDGLHEGHLEVDLVSLLLLLLQTLHEMVVQVALPYQRLLRAVISRPWTGGGPIEAPDDHVSEALDVLIVTTVEDVCVVALMPARIPPIDTSKPNVACWRMFQYSASNMCPCVVVQRPGTEHKKKGMILNSFRTKVANLTFYHVKRFM